MSLPLVLDVAIGLIFVYLILSLLASEIQELLATLLQWRAAHLKKSIELLLTSNGAANLNNETETNTDIGSVSRHQKTAREIVDKIYNNTLIRNISQESRGGIESFLRRLVRRIITFGRRKDSLTLATGSEPSYIPSETFATTILERLNLSQFTQKLTSLNLQKLVEHDINAKIKIYIKDSDLRISAKTRQDLAIDFNRLRISFREIYSAFNSGKITLLTTVNQLRDELNSYIEQCKLLSQSDPEVQKFINQMNALKRSIFYQDQSNANDNSIYELIARIQPGLSQVLEILASDLPEKNKTYAAFKEEFSKIALTSEEIHKSYAGVEEEIKQISLKLSPSVRESLAALANRTQINLRRAQTQVQVVEDEINQFQLEIQAWFDRSMDRASGVYKRNAKGVAFLIGFFLAWVTNADTFHIVSRLATDTALRDAMVQNSELVTTDCPPSSTSDPEESQLDCIRQQINQSIPLPIGRDPVNLKQQIAESEGWLYPPLKRILGWTISGLAISMGSSFWFEMLNKVINVRNTGKPPEKTPTS